ncbi:hypothetical protein KQI86_04885 [Clostridium sp. MSJ-11]|uniref:Uncharacterized protein n=1 Tax=Clostridium mobile TaxID=2841512 RepID=A0ABS6EGQ4_9CLOT|nr:hypothetical protein [Clostridium mobile]MBU5483655.1 hypothetical protein [Clostridium mobile]
MIYNINKYSYILRNSKNEFLNIKLDGRNLNIKPFNSESNSSLEIKDVILDYSVDIDKNDVIHLIYLCSDGKLKYKLYPSLIETTINNINLKMHNIRFLSLKLINNQIHIFYMLGNKINSQIWEICHSYWNGKKWINKKITQVFSQKYIYPYMISHDENNIYLFYSKDSQENYSIKKFNFNFHVWGTLEDNINIKNSHNITFFHHNNFFIICYNASINKTIKTLLRYKDISSVNQSWSSDLVISGNRSNSIHPSIFNIKNDLYVLWIEQDKAIYIKTNNINKWEHEKYIDVKGMNIINSIYISNNKEDMETNNNFMNFIEENIPIPIIELDKKINTKKIDNENINYEKLIPFEAKDIMHNISSINIETDKIILNELELKNNYIGQLSDIIASKDTMIHELLDKNKILNNNHDVLTKQIEELTEKNLHLSSQVKSTITENENLLSNADTKIEELNDLIKLKEDFIINLEKELELLANEIKSLKIELEEKSAKRPWRFF